MAEFSEKYQDLDDIKFDKRTKGNYQCNKCKQTFTLSGNYKRHVYYNKICGTKTEGFKCRNCHKQFSLNATMKEHYERCIAEDPYRFKCPYCTKVFTFKSSLNKHLRGRCRQAKNHKNSKVQKCKHCNAEFINYSAWRKHINEGFCTMENEQEQYVCPRCANRFTLKASLNKHLKGRCKAMKPEPIEKYEIVINLSQENGEEVVQPCEVVLKNAIKNDNDDDDDNEDDGDADGDDVSNDCIEWDGFETDDVEAYIEIANADGNELIYIRRDTVEES